MTTSRLKLSIYAKKKYMYFLHHYCTLYNFLPHISSDLLQFFLYCSALYLTFLSCTLIIYCYIERQWVRHS